MQRQKKDTGIQKKDISILTISIAVFFYFAVMILLGKLKYDAMLIGVFREMLTIPALGVLAATTFFSAAAFMKRRFSIHTLSFYSLLIEVVTIGLIIYIA